MEKKQTNAEQDKDSVETLTDEQSQSVTGGIDASAALRGAFLNQVIAPLPRFNVLMQIEYGG